MDKSVFTLLFSFLVLNTNYAEELNIFNNCGKSIFIKVEQVSSRPFSLEIGHSRTLNVSREAEASLYAQTGCDVNGNNCDTSEGRYSMATMHWEAAGISWYDISMVYGYNLPIRMEPYNVAPGGYCMTATCQFEMDRSCPDESKVFKDGETVGCRSLDFNTRTDYANAIKGACHEVISWRYDYSTSRHMCYPGNDGLRIIFC